MKRTIKAFANDMGDDIVGIAKSNRRISTLRRRRATYKTHRQRTNIRTTRRRVWRQFT